LAWWQRIIDGMRSAGIHPRDPALVDWLGGGRQTAAGVTVTADTALQFTAVYACVGVLAQTIAALPLSVYRRKPGGKERDESHALHELLHWRPNRLQTSFEWRELAATHTALRGSSYHLITRTPAGRVLELRPLHPDRVTPFVTPGGEVAYRLATADGAEVMLMDHDVLRIPGLTTDGVEALSPIALHRETVGTAMAGREYLGRFYGNSAVPKGALVTPGILKPEAAQALRESWEARHRGAGNANRLAILDGGMQWQAIGLSHEDAQYLELQQFHITDICRIFRVPPHKVADLSKATFSNIEHQAIEFVTDTILPWVTRIEQRLNGWLLTPQERRTHFIGFELKGLLRGDATARANFYRGLSAAGAMSPNDIRRLEDMDEIPGGDRYFVPMNMVPLDRVDDALDSSKAPAPVAPPQEDIAGD
jgi:HK97 family phage portal protein